MIKKLALYLLLASSSVALAQEEFIGLGRGLSDAINAIIIDESTQHLFAQIIDSYLDKVDFTQEQWVKLGELLAEGCELLERKTDEKLVAAQKEYEKEMQEILSVVFDKDGNVENTAETQAFLQEAMGELEKDERFAAMRSYAQEEQEFKNKVAMSLLADLSNLGLENQENKISVEDQLAQLKNVLQHVVKNVEAKITQ